MARVTSYEESKIYDTSEGLPIFSLADDGDSEMVQIVGSSLDDILMYTTHEIPMRSQNGNEYTRKISCLKQHPNDPAGVCPFCDCGHKTKIARFVPLYSLAKKAVVLWERSGQFIEQNILSTMNRIKHTMNKNPQDCVVEVVRSGRKGDRKTTYQLYPMDNQPAVDLSSAEIPDPEGTLIATWSAADMRNYIETGAIPQKSPSNTADNSQVHRRESRAPEANAADYGYASPQAPVADFTGSQPVSDPTAMF